MKVLKDPIYGYIKLEKDILDKIVDTPEFQRLRHIEQTSYTPLYSSALHNRFVHSIGVYHLGRIASDSLLEFITTNEELKSLNDKKQIQILWYHFLFEKKSFYEILGPEESAKEIMDPQSFFSYFGFVFETICLEYMIRMAKNRKLPFIPSKYGKCIIK